MNDKFKEPVKIGMPRSHNLKLDAILEHSGCIFSEKRDIYRLAISLAIKEKKIGDKNAKYDWKNYTVEQIDPEPKYFYNIVKSTYPDEEEAVYTTVQRLATAGIEILHGNFEKNGGDILLSHYLDDK
jgi:hypothetical protein